MTAKTPIDLYREGNSATPRFDELPPKDITVQPVNGVPHVQAGKDEGISTQDAVTKPKGKWWRLAAGSDYDDSVLRLVNDLPGHWQWEPACDMPVDKYRTALTDVQMKFTPVWRTINPSGHGGPSP